MKTFLFALLSYFLVFPAVAQTNLYIIYDPNAPDVLKDVRKYKGLPPSETRMSYCGMTKSDAPLFYLINYPFYAGANLLLYRDDDLPIQTISASQVSSLGHVRTPAQLDADLQPAIDYYLQHGASHPALSAPVVYFEQFARIYVIEYAGNEAKLIPVYIGNEFE